MSLAGRPDRARALARYAESDREDLKQVPVAAVAHGKGELLCFMLQTDGRYRREDPDFDPAVERLMINLLGPWRESK